MHYYQNYIKKVHEPSKKDKKCYYNWVVVGHNFNYDIYFYKLKGNNDGKMN